MHSSLYFEKYQGTGNDFIIIDHRKESRINHADNALIATLCDRKFGIGADGLILLEESTKADFRMVYFNSDGNQSTMCGNGGRCMIQFAFNKGIFSKETTFEAIDGLHKGKVLSPGIVSLEMIDVKNIHQLDEATFELNTGSPHYVTFGQIPENIKSSGASIRYSDSYKTEGINVNFVLPEGNCLQVATYERGVEDETLSCGTGVTAAALAYMYTSGMYGQNVQQIQTKGGRLTVKAKRNEDGTFTDIWLEGPAVKVFEGNIDLALVALK